MTNTAKPATASDLAAALGVTDEELAALDAAGREFIAATDTPCVHRDRTITDHLDYHECLACGAILRRETRTS